MSRLARFARKPQILEFEVEDEEGNVVVEKIKVSPLKVKDQAIIMEMTGGGEGATKAATLVLEKVYKDNGIDDFSPEEFENVDWDFADAILNAALKVSTGTANDARAKFIAEMKAKQESSKKAKEDAEQGIAPDPKAILEKVVGNGQPS